MTEQEFTSLIETYGFELDIQENYIFARIPNRYNKPILNFIEKKDGVFFQALYWYILLVL